jgi:histidyl-tRNA synthetase
MDNTPPKGTNDWFPEEFALRSYIFSKWRAACIRFGYQEYLAPVFEKAEIYKAKSGEDIGGKELMIFNDKAGREYALRPEMTPSVTRMVTRVYGGLPKPVRWFSIANFVRNEKPQRGRNREFWQLNFDIFGSQSNAADIEVIRLAMEIMLSFSPPAGSFTVQINNRRLIDFVLGEVAGVSTQLRGQVVRILDKTAKLSALELSSRLKDLGLDDKQIELLLKFVSSHDEKSLVANLPQVEASQGLAEIREVLNYFADAGLDKWMSFNPSIIRGFDYYDGMVFEVFDNHPENNRALFGGGRYNGLAELFGSQQIAAVGAAPGDETTKLFLQSWDLLDQVNANAREHYYAPLLSGDSKVGLLLEKIKNELRSAGEIVMSGLEVESLGRALKQANKFTSHKIIILGDEELAAGVYKIKNMQTGEEREIKLPQ